MHLKTTILLTLLSHAAVSQTVLSRDQMQEDLRQLREALVHHHPGLYRYSSEKELDEAMAAAISKAADPMSTARFYRVITGLTARIRCGHTRARPGRTDLRRLMARARQVPVEIALLEGRTIITACDDKESGLDVPCELIAIDGVPTASLCKRILPTIQGDGFTETGRSRELQANFALHYALQIDPKMDGPSFDLKIRSRNGKATSVQVRGKRFSPPSSTGNRPPLALEIMPTGIAVLTVSTFSSSRINRSGHDYRKFLDSSIRKLRKKGVDKLILDLRGNGGGTDQFGAALVAHLYPRPFRYFERIEVTPQHAKDEGVKTDAQGRHLVTTHPGLQEQQPAKEIFQGRLIVLIDGGTFSTAADVVTVLHRLKIGEFVGEECGGGADGNTSGHSHRLTLTHSGILVNIPMWQYTTAYGAAAPTGRGVRPDHPVERTIEDLRDGADPELRKAIQLLEKT